MACVTLGYKDVKKHLPMKANTKSFSEYIRKQLKYEHRIRSKTGTSLEVILNFFKLSYSISCSTKILNLAIALFSLISVDVLCEVSEGTGVHIL